MWKGRSLRHSTAAWRVVVHARLTRFRPCPAEGTTTARKSLELLKNGSAMAGIDSSPSEQFPPQNGRSRSILHRETSTLSAARLT